MRRYKIALSGLSILALLTAGFPASALDSPALSLARQLNEAFIQVADDVSPAVVVIEVTEKAAADDQGQEGSWWDLLPPEERPRHRRHHGAHAEKVQAEGSGVVISKDGYILTNNHVVDNAEKIVVRFKDGRSFEATVTGTDSRSDIAVIKIPAKGLTPAKLGDSDATRVGEFVVAIGAPFALSYSVTCGHVSAKGRSFEGESGMYADQDFIQTDAAINPGNSGGPLVNLYGEVIAINTMIEGMNTGIGFAVPINLAKRVKDHLISDGKFTRSWIGVGIDELRGSVDYADLAATLPPDVQDGVVVSQVFAHSPASRSDLRTGDVIVSVDSKSVKTSRQLKDAIALTPPGHLLALNVVRGSDRVTVSVKTEALPTDDTLMASQQPAEVAADSPAFGLTVQATTKDIADQYGIKANSGVLVTAVDRVSPAEEKGIQPGDIITQINRKTVVNPQQFRQALESVDAKKGLMLNLLNNGSSRLVILKNTEP